MDLPEHLRPLCEAFLAGLRSVLGDKLAAVTYYGAVAFPETTATGDLDGHVLLAGPLTGSERAGLLDVHAALACDHPPYGGELDVLYFLLADAQGTAPPRDQLRPGVADAAWALHCAHIRAGRCIRSFSSPSCLAVSERLCPAPTWAALEAALHGELRYVEEHLMEYPAYCVLNLCRLVYSFQTRVVVISKVGAAAWARHALPRWLPLIDAAERWYAGRATAHDQALLQDGAPALLRHARRRIAGSAHASPAHPL